jgi:tRNA A37 threonylcarbamoyladenosine synthetase subunit TsaC/SUA5/YrdC
VKALLEELREPIMSVTLTMPDDQYPLTDPYEIKQLMNHHVDVIIDGGYCGLEPTTVIDLTDHRPQLLRQGAGDFSAFE